MDTVELVVVAIGALLLALVASWLLMKMIVSGMARRILTSVREFIERARGDRRRVPRETPDRRSEWERTQVEPTPGSKP